MVHIHVTGASGPGTTSLGRVLAKEIGISHLDTDDFFWLRTDPLFTTPRDREERIDLLRKRALPHQGWVLSGVRAGLGREDRAAVRPGRVPCAWSRSVDCSGCATGRRPAMARASGPAATIVDEHREFMEWAARYDTAGLEQRSLVAHEQWLATQTCPVLRLDSSRPVADLVRDARGHPAART
jgi:hypothetical protein